MPEIRHDDYFKFLFSEPEQAAGLIRFCLGPDSAELLELDQLQPMPRGYFSPEGKEGECDLLFKCPLKGLGKELLIAILLEHKSYPDRGVLLQMARYWANLVAQPEPMPIIPILFYHGDRPFHVGTTADLFPWLPQEWVKLQPLFPHVFVDLLHRNHREILTMEGLDPVARLGLIALLAVFDENTEIHGYIQAVAERLQRLTHEKRQPFVERTIVYLTHRSNHSTDTVEVLMNIGNEEDDIDRDTLAKRLRAEGRKEGLEEGREEGFDQGRSEAWKESARKMKAKGLSVSDIAEITGLSPAEIREL